MINLLLFIAALTLFGIAAAWLAENPGQVTMYWFDWRIDTSLAVLVGSGLLAALLLAYIYVIIRSLMHAPAQWTKHRKLQHYQKGLSEITYSVAALAASDLPTAELHTRKAEKLLGSTPLTLLLSAQIARSQGKDETTRQLLESMLAHKETEYLASRSLSDAANKQHLLPRALLFAERAHRVNPKEKLAVIALISLHIRLQQWEEAQQVISGATRKGALSRLDGKRYKGLVHLHHGRQLLERGDNALAMAQAHQAGKLLRGFVPATLFVAETAMAGGHIGKASSSLFTQWQIAPHPDVARLFRRLIALEPKDRQLKLLRKLAAAAPNHLESHILLAEFYCEQRQWSEARKSLKQAMLLQETARTCLLMADIERGEFSDYDAAGRWMARSASAYPNSHWACRQCGASSEHWQMHCPSCEAFDTMAWS